jgi:hypothetical protein
MSDTTNDIDALLRDLFFNASCGHKPWRHAALTALIAERDGLREQLAAAQALNKAWEQKAATWLATPEAAARLQSYRDLGQQAAQAQNESDALRAELAAMRDATAWIPCFERLPEPGQPVLVAIGKSVLRAMHAPHFTLSEDDWGEFEPHADYDEVTDRTYWPEGWYESDQHEERQFRLEREPTHWMPLPQPPREKEGGGAC